ncbi:efflux RND transporter periplasmic adaptor subunit [Sulfurovum sp. ST-21]|uniref:Efflux RND transporter periplasmic adaptor subunit n=1 Tax=Sulfurovum indicum TaxID=2779528 RepID=A0A7M1S2P8_9BACT|nr:efflux RND transporter periplasmic adaptor subunit [Sulfurovum indicum]QOR61281.1 efflux RND transporter periplasmic adaptor subunit [Sulfurovum indicum]
MKKFYILMTVSIIGLALGITAVGYGDRIISSKTVPIPSVKLPFKSFIAGTGIVEAESKNITVGSPVSGLIQKVYVQSGDKIQKGTLLFEIDDTLLQSRIMVSKAEIKAARAKLTRIKHHFELIENFKKVSPQMVTKEQYIQAQDRYKEAQEMFEISKVKLSALQEQLKRYKIYSPIDGTVLRSKISKGDFFDNRSNALIIGSDNVNVRVSINEYDISKFKPGTKAVAYMRGNHKEKIELSYRYTIPYVMPKTNLTGRSTERTDTRVLQVVYAVKRATTFPLYVGEQLDIFIQTPRQGN